MPTATGERVEHVTDIDSVKGSRGGLHVEDSFKVLSTEVLEKIIGPFNAQGAGGLAVFRERERTGVVMVPPLEFIFKTWREPGVPAIRWRTELHVTAHFMCIVQRQGRGGGRFAFDTARAAYTDEHKLAYKIAAADALRRLGPEHVPAALLRFLALPALV
jgi:hypothetical protein